MSTSKKRKIFRNTRQTQSKKTVRTYSREDEGSQLSGQYMEDSIAAVESILMYRFKDKKLLEAALTHSSFTESESYEYLEFIGDAALGIAITDFVSLAYPHLDPGQLSLLRAANISTEKLARVAVRNGLYKYFRHRTTVLDNTVREFVSAVKKEEEMVVHGGQRKAPKVLADIVESVAGAVYVDCGRNSGNMWMIIRRLLEPLVLLNVLNKQPQPITMLYEACQKEGKMVDIRHWRNGERSIVSVYVDRTFIASASSENKENARLQAAEVALDKLNSTHAISLLHMNPDFNENTTKAPKCKIHELCNEKRWPMPKYRIEEELGPAHKRRYIASVQVEVSDKIYIIKGEEKSRVNDAKNSAASMMLHALRDMGY